MDTKEFKSSFPAPALTYRLCGGDLTWSLSQLQGFKGAMYRKRIARAGAYVKGDQTITIPAELIPYWAETGNVMLSRGREIPLPLEHTEDRDANRGWVRHFEAVGRDLYADIEVIAEHPDELVSRYDVSINVPPSYSDGEHLYTRPVTHVALTEVPVIGGLGQWERLAASFRPMTPSNVHNEGIKPVEPPAMNMSKLLAKLGVTCDPQDAAAEGLALVAVDALIARGTAQPLALSNKPDARLVGLARTNYSLRLKALVAGGAVLPAVAKRLEAEVLAVEPVISLSLADAGHDILGLVLDILGDNRTLELGGRTGPQTELTNSLGDKVDDGVKSLHTVADRMAAARTAQLKARGIN